MSRVAVSHLEAGMSHPSERTVTLLAGLFRIEPYELVAGTTYPAAKVERLPPTAARYTEAAMQLAVMAADLCWANEAPEAVRARVVHEWRQRLRALLERPLDSDDRQSIRDWQNRLALDEQTGQSSAPS
jgi:hypothetical protein